MSKFLKYIVGVFLCCCSFAMYGQGDMPMAKQGVLDLSSIDFLKKENLLIKGEWEFYYNELLTPLDFDANRQPKAEYQPVDVSWSELPTANGEKRSNFGYATYRLIVKLPDEHPQLALNILESYTASKFWVNGKYETEIGKVGTSKKEYRPVFFPTTTILSEDTTSLEIVIQISNYSHQKAQLSDYPIIGRADIITKIEKRKLVYEAILLGSLIMGGLLYLGLYFLGNKDRSMLSFSLFCFSFVIYTANTSLYIIRSLFYDASWSLLLTLEYTSLFLSILFFASFVHHIFPKDSFLWAKKIIQGYSWVLIAIAILFPPIIFTQSLVFFFPFLFIGVLYLLYVFLVALYKRREGAGFAMLSMFCMVFGAVIILLDYLNIILPQPTLLFFANIGFFFFQTLILSFRFAKSIRSAAAKAQLGTQSKAGFLATMSHEIRTPMNGVLGMTTLLSQSTLNPEQRNYVESVRLSGQHLVSLINDILDYSKIESGKMELEKQEFDIESCVEDVIELLSAHANQKQLKIYYTLDHTIPAVLVGDVTRIKQVLTNLIENAIKFTSVGYIFINVSLKELLPAQAILSFDVKDTGIGISPEKIEHIFGQFSQADTFFSRKYGGTGLGLAISKRLANLMGGDIIVDSKEDVGSTFSFGTTLGYISSNKQGKHQEIITPLQQYHAIIVSRDIQLTHILSNLLKQQEMLYDVLIDMKSAMDFLTIHPYYYQLILLDQSLIDNESDIKQLRNIATYKDIPIILFENPTLPKLALSLPHLSVISNPYKLSDIRHSLKNLFIRGYSPPKTPKATVEVEDKKLSTLKILVAEDHTINQKLMTHLLGKYGYTADIVSNGLEAVEAVERQWYDIVFMDVQMPEMDGFEATQRIHESMTKKGSPIIIAMTANAMQGDKEACIAAGMDDYVSKPIKFGIIKEMIEKWGTQLKHS